MGYIKVKSEKKEKFTTISNIFIDRYMPEANGEFVKLYIYLIRLLQDNIGATVSSIADKMSCQEKDVCRGIKYWISKGILDLKYDKAEDTYSITLLKLEEEEEKESSYESDDYLMNIIAFQKNEKKTAAKKESVTETVNEVTPVSSETTSVTKKNPSKKRLTQNQLNLKLQDPELMDLRDEAEAYFQRELAQEDMNSLIYIHDELHFSFDLCEYLLEYCGEIKKTDSKFYEKVAINWYENEITTRAEAKEFTLRYFTLYGKILEKLGIQWHSINVKEKSFINKWTTTFLFDNAIILKACEIAIVNSPSKATFNYVDGILTKWHAAGVKTLKDVDSYQSSTVSNVISVNNSKKRNINSFKQTDHSDDLKMIEDLYMDEVKEN